MNVSALVCTRCGGPLAAKELPAIIECTFCGVTLSITQEALTVTKEGTRDQLRAQQRSNALQQFHDDLAEALKAGHDPYESVREATTTYLGDAGPSEACARVTIALAREFERTENVKIIGEGIVLARIAQAYLRSVENLSQQGHGTTDEINLPFLFATAKGPVHLQRKVTAALFAELALRDPHAVPPPPVEAAAPPPPQPEPPKKRKKLFGLF